MVDGLIARIAQEMGTKPTVVATGGLASIIAGVAKRIDHVDPLLTLKGLKSVYHKNEKGAA
jgi:type III pantothenate kinase